MFVGEDGKVGRMGAIGRPQRQAPLGVNQPAHGTAIKAACHPRQHPLLHDIVGPKKNPTCRRPCAMRAMGPPGLTGLP